MGSSVRWTGYSVLLAGIVASGLSTSAFSFPLLDNYSGGTDTCPTSNSQCTSSDLIGTQTFSVTSADITRSGVNNSTLKIRIYTNYAGAPGTGAADGTQYGSLFLSPGFWTPHGTGPAFSDDNYYDNKQWSYAVTNPTGVTGNSNPVGLYAIGSQSGVNLYSGSSVIAPNLPYNPGYAGVPVSFTTANGVVVMSNVNGDPVTYPGTSNNGYYFRQGQAVQYTPGNGQSVVDNNGLTSATFTVGNGYLDYVIIDNGLFGDIFALSWAMTCANDIIQGQVSLSSTDLTGTPLPAALPMFSAGLGMLGLMGWRRKRKKAALAA